MRKYVARRDAVEVHAIRGDLVVRIFPNGTLEIESRRGTSFKVIDIDYSANAVDQARAPVGATHEIHAYRVDENGDAEGLNGDVDSVYFGCKGIILDKVARERARKLPLDQPKYRGED